jgi:hypothetical protein
MVFVMYLSQVSQFNYMSRGTMLKPTFKAGNFPSMPFLE